jgi:hypothetical protein
MLADTDASAVLAGAGRVEGAAFALVAAEGGLVAAALTRRAGHTGQARARSSSAALPGAGAADAGMAF